MQTAEASKKNETNTNETLAAKEEDDCSWLDITDEEEWQKAYSENYGYDWTADWPKDARGWRKKLAESEVESPRHCRGDESPQHLLDQH